MARKQTGDNQPEDQNTGGADGEEKIPNVQADHNSLALGSFHVEGDVDAPVVFGHGNVVTVGFTAEQAFAFLQEIRSDFQPRPFDGTCPYKGLDVFTEDDVELFFGREAIVKDLVSRVSETRAVFVTGASGSGKSSLVRAGLIPALKKAELSRRWLYATLTPERDPLEALARAFSRLKDPSLGTYFRENKQHVSVLNDCAESALSDDPNQRLVLFVDQFEEVFTQLSRDKTEAFISLIDHAGTVEDGRLILLFSLRSDFLSICQTYPQLNALLGGKYAFAPIGAMQPQELASAIAQPALRVGLNIDPALVAQIINDMRGEPGALPLMQFALKDLFDTQQAQGGVIALTLDDYLGHGGIRKSLERHADRSFARLGEGEQQLARSIFSGLIEIGRGTQDTRRTTLFEELVPAKTDPEEIKAVVQKLAGARLIITDEQAGKDTVTIAHEKLIDAWPWLKNLVKENRDTIALQNEIANDAKEWDDHGRDASYLYSGARLATAQEKIKNLVLSENAGAYLAAGTNAEKEARRQRERAVRRTIIGLISFSAIVLALLIFSLVQLNISRAQQLGSQAQAAFAEGDYNTALLYAYQSHRIHQNNAAGLVLGQIPYENFPGARQLNGHTDFVSTVAWSADGRLASGSEDNTVIVWDLDTRQPAQILRGHTSSVSTVAWSADGRLTSGSDDHTIIVWDLKTGEPAQTLKGHTGIVTSVAWSADNRLASGSGDGTVIVWDLKTGQPAQILREPTSSVYSVAWSADNRLASGSLDGTVIVWDLKTSRPAQTLRGHTDNVTSVAWSADNRLASGSGDDTVIVWDLKTGQPAQTLRGHTFSVTSVAWSSDNRLASGSGDGTVIVWDLKTGQPAQTLKGHRHAVSSVAWSADGRLASGSYDGTVIVWDLKTGQPAQILKGHTDYVYSVSWLTDGRLASGSGDSTIKIARADMIRGDLCQKIFRNMTVDEWLSLQGSLYVYQPACPNLPVPAIDPIGGLLNGDIELVMLAWSGRALLLGVALLFLALLFGIFWILRKLASWIWKNTRGRFGKKPARA